MQDDNSSKLHVLFLALSGPYQNCDGTVVVVSFNVIIWNMNYVGSSEGYSYFLSALAYL
jgi:hypothetical protein